MKSNIAPTMALIAPTLLLFMTAQSPKETFATLGYHALTKAGQLLTADRPPDVDFGVAQRLSYEVADSQ